MKMTMLTYNEAMDEEVMQLLEECGLRNYTKLEGTHGKGETSGTHLGSETWPGLNNILYIACEDVQAKKIVAGVKELRKRLGREGVKAFVWEVEEVT